MSKIVLLALVAAVVVATAAAPGANAASPRVLAGAKIFAANCTGCHGATGTGQPGVFPSLVANPYVSGDAKRLIHTVKFGLTGKIVAKGVPYDGMMPAWAGTLTDPQIADVISYIRTTWGNKGSSVTAAQVRGVKK
ncbi:MAG TPA: cytochrome c [Xanthomonadales bacterium]|nr:cytochrome c [Xanthomonadales bacterium]